MVADMNIHHRMRFRVLMMLSREKRTSILPMARSLPLPEGQTVHGALMVGIPKYRYRRIPPRKAVRAVWV